MQQPCRGGTYVVEGGGQLSTGLTAAALRHRAGVGRKIGRVGHHQPELSRRETGPVAQVGLHDRQGQAVDSGVAGHHMAGMTIQLDAGKL